MATDTPTNNPVDREHEDFKQVLACVREITREFENMASRRRMTNAQLTMLNEELSQMSRRGPGVPIRFENRAGDPNAAAIQALKQSLERRKAALKEMCDAASNFAQELIQWGEALEKRRSRKVPSDTGNLTTRQPVEKTIGADLYKYSKGNSVNEMGLGGGWMKTGANWVWNQGGLKSDLGLTADVINNLAWGTLYDLSRASDYANALIISTDPIEVLTTDVQNSETSQAAANNIDLAGKSGWYDPRDPSINLVKTLLNFGIMFINPEGAEKNVVSSETGSMGKAGVVKANSAKMSLPLPTANPAYTWPGHATAPISEAQLAKTASQLPNELVVAWGNAIGTHGADVISVNAKTGMVTLWDSKFRSKAVTIQESSTFAQGSASQANVINQAIETIDVSTSLSSAVKNQAIQNLRNNQVRTITAGAGNAKNSIIGH